MSKYNSIQIGDKASVVHKITQNDIEKFVTLTGDDNKLHISKEYASKTEFKIPVAHGMLGASFISTVIGTKLPGDGALWFSQSLEFVKPVRIDDTLTVEAEVISKNDKANVIELKTTIFNQYKQVVTNGIAKVKIIEQLEEETIAASQPAITVKTALVLGATGGIGRETVKHLAAAGYDILLHYNQNETLAARLKKEVEETGASAHILKADLLNILDVERMIKEAKRMFPFISAFVNCSTVKLPNIKFTNLNWDFFQEQLDIYIKVNFHILKELLPQMEEKKYGKIVFLTSQAIESPNSDWAHYITSKAALNGFVKAVAIEYASKGININMVSPSMIDTDLVADIPKKVKMLIEAKTPLKRLCTTADVANAILFLVSDRSGFMTGETLRLNGGQIMI